MKKFFGDLKRDIKFKSAGQGHALNVEPSPKPVEIKAKAPEKPRKGPAEEAQMAAAAAMTRLDINQHRARGSPGPSSLKMDVKKSSAAHNEARSQNSQASSNSNRECRTDLSVNGVYFICPLTAISVHKTEREAHIKEALLTRLVDDPIGSSIMMIHTFNKDKEKVKIACETLAKYIDNICNNPTEEKYRKIKLQNKVFQERISELEGTHEFLQSIGFERKTFQLPGQDHEDDFYVLNEKFLATLEQLRQYKDDLLNAEPLRLQLDRRIKVFRPTPQAARFELPDDFYNLTAEEVKREQQMRSDAVERNSMLRTKAMRERNEQRELKKYNYTLLRVRLPDGYILQGTFYARERVSALRAFISSTLMNDWMPFQLVAPGGHKLKDDDSLFNEVGLVPAALLTLTWDAEILADLEAAGQNHTSILKPELLSNVQTLV
ncbi:UBX domain-containing protein 6 [Callorhinchus milii]|uniref:UBX domain-containing protein 6 n=1 Tax=Callorhinchus milii TaxID=7868 RepID=UPI0004574050|nr:UBX domain-containing protein 6 [Callorhinchus milii]|eukprot:gi/632966271/ref/XP_007899322.1/ PREDICTED: UBX domain-containing protein 6 [Callorhinchus milii]